MEQVLTSALFRCLKILEESFQGDFQISAVSNTLKKLHGNRQNVSLSGMPVIDAFLWGCGGNENSFDEKGRIDFWMIMALPDAPYNSTNVRSKSEEKSCPFVWNSFSPYFPPMAEYDPFGDAETNTVTNKFIA